MSISLMGCWNILNHNFEIRIGGTAGKPFSGSYMVVANGSSNSHSVEGVIPQSYIVQEATMVSAVFQKKSTDGFLTVTVLRDGETVKTEGTSAEYGMVTVATQ
jgi:hypothetical protein